ncbi:hypothetical protein [Aeromonas caviae]|nr:hypothetical protein [Aeromonas caviae]
MDTAQDQAGSVASDALARLFCCQASNQIVSLVSAMGLVWT